MPTPSPASGPRETRRCSCPRCRAHDAGRRGPFTSAEFVELFGVANEPEPVEVAPELAALGIAVDVARTRYDAARDGWSAAHRSVALAESAQSRYTVTSPAERQALEAARAEEDAAKEELDEAGAALSRAQVAYNDLARRLQERAYGQAYAAEQATLAADREAARERARAASQRRGLRALRAKVSGLKT